ncbi:MULTISPECIES: spermidine synthase [unclassified Oceanispirochaeta]|uniref:spermidine synthase n=1 Tax=unclassified Oceanispirochaeta TaxID=2635722 RepID=UPI000E091D21|nr:MULTISPECIES: spermidine synthase [unclassified Oceanispirochaeta]MBF9018550.1 spermidine synthase [Oceanispirochaeta sp. M2]NPD74957.1 spermidine synthase [Oceanispirochaeta sp. M1]RDG29188.1 spermidine synthase [Oceanispirochaeta sp. M1]
MSLNYEELDFQKTPIGDLMLRRRRMLQLGNTDIYEVKLGEHFLMTSLFHESESQLSVIGLGETDKKELDIVVGGLGLGYTAVAALEDTRVKSLVIVEYLEAVIGWHKDHLVPMGKTLTDDSRCRIVNADFFALARDEFSSFEAETPSKKYDAILLDIDHTPSHVLSQTNKHFYTEKGLAELAQHLKPEGVFGLWADGSPQESFRTHLEKVFNDARSHHIQFENPITGGSSEGTVYVGRKLKTK